MCAPPAWLGRRVGRVGAIAGPVLGGMLLATLPRATLFLIVGLTSLCAAGTVFAAMGRLRAGMPSVCAHGIPFRPRQPSIEIRGA